MRKKSSNKANMKAATAKAKEMAAEIVNSPVVEEAKETVKKAVNEAAKTINSKKFAEATIEFPGLSVTMSAIEAAVSKDIEAKELSGKEIHIYVNADQKAAYYTVDGQGADDYKVDLNTL